jgi:hypothetical protein
VLRRIVALVGSLTLAWAVGPAARAQDAEEPPALLLIMDSSGSMNADDGTGRPKVAAAKDSLTSLVDELPEDSLVGLRVYGHRVSNAPSAKPRGCRDTELIVPVRPLERAGMKARIRSFGARGWTPIGLSLREAAGDLRGFSGRRTIVLVSDGIDTCAPPPPCEVARDVSERGIAVRIDTVGFQVDARARRMLRCIARVSGGQYFDAPSSDELGRRLEALSARALRVYEVIGTPVDGAATEASAPVLEPGRYVDEIAPNEALYYAAEIGPGQSLRVSTTLVPARRGGHVFVTHYQLQFHNPEVIADPGDVEGPVGAGPTNLSAETKVAGTTDPDSPPPGRQVFELSLHDPGEDLPPTFPIELVVEVRGEAVEPPTPPDDRAQAPTPAAGGAEPWAWVVVIGLSALAGLLAGDRVAARVGRGR